MHRGQGAQTFNRGSVNAGPDGCADEHQKHVPETYKRPNTTDSNAADNQESGYAQPTSTRGEKIVNSSPEVRSKIGHEGHDNSLSDQEESHYTRSTRAEKDMSDDAKDRIARNEGNMVTLWSVER